MDEFDLTRRLLGGGDDEAALARVGERLARAIDAEEAVKATARLRHRRRGLALAGVAACLAAITVISFVLPLDAPSAVASTLDHLRTVAAAAQGPKVGPDQFLYTHSEELDPVGMTVIGSPSLPSSSINTIVRLSVQTWIAADGSGERRSVATSVRFASDDDRSTWQAAGRPDLKWSPGQVLFEKYPSGQAPWFDVGSLPLDPSRLESTLRASLLRADEDGPLYQRIGEVLAQGDSSPDLRAALFDVASRINGVQLVGEVTDPLGRAGTAIALDWNGERTQLVFNTDTSDLLAMETYPLDSNGLPGPLTYWRAFYPTTVVDSAHTH